MGRWRDERTRYCTLDHGVTTARAARLLVISLRARANKERGFLSERGAGWREPVR